MKMKKVYNHIAKQYETNTDEVTATMKTALDKSRADPANKKFWNNFDILGIEPTLENTINFLAKTIKQNARKN